MTQELCDAWKSFSEDEHIPLHEYMMALSIRIITTTQFGAFFRKQPENIKSVAGLYNEVMKSMDDILTGKLHREDTARYDLFLQRVEDFRKIAKLMIQSQKDARFYLLLAGVVVLYAHCSCLFAGTKVTLRWPLCLTP